MQLRIEVGRIFIAGDHCCDLIRRAAFQILMAWARFRGKHVHHLRKLTDCLSVENPPKFPIFGQDAKWSGGWLNHNALLINCLAN